VIYRDERDLQEMRHLHGPCTDAHRWYVGDRGAPPISQPARLRADSRASSLLVAIAPVRVVSLLDAVADRVRASGIRRAAIFGTRLVMGTGAFDLLGSVELGGIVG